MNQSFAHGGLHNRLAFKTSAVLIALALVNVALIPILLGCERTDAAPGSAMAASSAARPAAAAEAVSETYLPRRYTLQPNAVEGNVQTHEHD